MKMRSKQGNITIFIAVIISTLISICFILINAFHEKSIESCSDGVFRLAADSVLSEYNSYIQQDYGLFLIKGTDAELSKKFRNYSNYTLDSLNGLDFKSCSVSAGRFNLTDINLIHNQIISHMKSSIHSDMFNDMSSNDNSMNGMTNRTLRHGPTIDSLPSSQIPDKSLSTSAKQFYDNIKDPEEIIKGSGNKFLIDKYILTHFNSNSVEHNRSHFYRNEVEYILYGKLSDEKNIKNVNLALEGLRTAPNLAHIYSDPKKRDAVLAASEVLTPGVLGTVTQAGISLVWATAESINDVKLLQNGYHVPFVKDSDSWALTLDSVIKGIKDEDYFKPRVDKGHDYSDYLNILLFLKDENIKTARILDLIQINMRKNYDRNFLIQEYSSGISYNAQVNDKSYYYDSIY